MAITLLAVFTILAGFVSSLYLWRVNQAMVDVPPEALALSPHRWTVEGITDAAERLSRNPPDIVRHLPPRTGRRYIVVGGAGFVGGWIVKHLLLRGEDPKNIRIVNRRPPSRKDMLVGKTAEVPFVSADVRDLASVRAAFSLAWPNDGDKGNVGTMGLTVFHTAAFMGYDEHHPSLLPRSTAVNVDGTRNALIAAREVGVNIFIFTSSPSLTGPHINYWILPWQKHNKDLVQVVTDETFSSISDRKHPDFISNYTYTKYLAEKLVYEADDPAKGFRTGCLRAGNCIYGSGGDLCVEKAVSQVVNPTWAGPLIGSFAYVENMSYGHLLYEERLIEALRSPPTSPLYKLGGQGFLITDNGGPISFGDLYLAINQLTHNRIRFPFIPVIPLFILAHLVEAYHLLQMRLLTFLPELNADLIQLQPSIFSALNVHLKVDDRRARLPPSEGGLGYQPLWSTLEGVCQYFKDHRDDYLRGEEVRKRE